jgi:hypothetical protein
MICIARRITRSAIGGANAFAADASRVFPI